MFPHRHLVIAVGLCFLCTSFVEVVAEFVDETCTQDAQQQSSQGEALLQMEAKRAVAHQQQQHDKARMGPQGLRLLSQGHASHDKGIQLTSQGRHAAPHRDHATEDSVQAFVASYNLQKRLDAKEEKARRTSKKEAKESDFGDNEDVSMELDEEEKIAQKKKPQGKFEKAARVKESHYDEKGTMVRNLRPKHRKPGHEDEKGKLAKAEAIYDAREETAPKTESGPVDANENVEDDMEKNNELVANNQMHKHTHE